MTTLADASTVDLNSPSTWVVLAVAAFVALAFLIREACRAPVQEAEPSRLDLLDGIDGAGRCSDRRPHRMLPTEYGWRCANDCGESWYVDPADELAMADLALWELENQWEEA